MKPKNDITYDAVAELLRYEPDTGKLYWRVDRLRGRYQNIVSAKAGDEAGCLHKSVGYVYVRVNGRKRRAHRLAWLLTYGEWPDNIDHINGVKDDNRIDNLRSVTQQENCQAFRKTSASASSKYRGVCWRRNLGKWFARIKVDGKEKHLGYFNCELEAARAYDAKAEELGFAEEALNRTHYSEVGDDKQ